MIKFKQQLFLKFQRILYLYKFQIYIFISLTP
jgi:hypothetical protein